MSVMKEARGLALVTLRASGPALVAPRTVHARKAAALAGNAAEARLKAKIDQSDKVLSKLEALQADLSEKIARLQLRKKRAEKRAEKISDRVISEMERANRTEAGGYRVLLATRPCPAAVLITNAALLPLQFVKVETTKTPVKALIKAALSSDVDVPGAKLTQGVSLIRKAA